MNKNLIVFIMIVVVFIGGVLFGNFIYSNRYSERDKQLVDMFNPIFEELSNEKGYEVGVNDLEISINLKLTDEDYAKYDEIKNGWLLTNPNNLIQIQNESDVYLKREQLINYIWKDGFPDELPIVYKDINDSDFSEFLAREIDAYEIDMEYGINSIAYHFKSENPNGRLVIYNQGHDGGFIASGNIINTFLYNGYDVLAFSMPLLGSNNIVRVDTKKYGTLLVADHDTFFLLEDENFSPIKYFVHPVAVSLNYIEQNYNYTTIAMMGYSGGGWTTTLYAALDDRIQKSYPIASSEPFYLIVDSHRRDYSIGSDYETINPRLYSITNYLELYVLGSYGKERNQIRILNKYDSCCFNGIGYLTYANVIGNKIEQLGEGGFNMFSDDTHKEHKISEATMRVILYDLQR